MGDNALEISAEYESLNKRQEELKKKILSLIVERDELLYQTCLNLKADFMVKIGNLEYQSYKLEIEIRRVRRKIELIQAQINRQKIPDLKAVEDQIEAEFQVYQSKIDSKAEEIKAAVERVGNGMELSKEDSAELKTLYRKIVKSLHPDLHPDVTEEQIKLFQTAVQAFENGDLNLMQSISAVVEEESSDLAADIMTLREERKKQITQLEIQVETLENRIKEIKSSFPYNQIEFLSDDQKVSEAQRALKNDISIRENSLKIWNQRLAEIMGNKKYE